MSSNRDVYVCPECGDADTTPFVCHGPMGAGEHRPPVRAARYVPTGPTDETGERVVWEAADWATVAELLRREVEHVAAGDPPVTTYLDKVRRLYADALRRQETTNVG